MSRLEGGSRLEQQLATCRSPIGDVLKVFILTSPGIVGQG